MQQHRCRPERLHVCQGSVMTMMLMMLMMQMLNFLTVHYLVGVCNEFRSPSAYWSATAIRHCADRTPEVVWPRGPGRQVSRSFPCSTSLHIACPKELEAASRSSKTYLAKDGDLRQFNLGLASGLRRAQNRTAWRTLTGTATSPTSSD